MKIAILTLLPMLYLFPKKHLENRVLSPYLCIIETRNGAIRKFEFRLFFTKRLTTMAITNTSSPLQTTSMRELLENPAERQPVLVEPLFPQCGLGAVIGSSDCGKSTLLRQLAACVAGGRDFLLWKTFPVHKRVLYVSTEDDSGAMSELLKRQNKAWQLSKEEAERVEFLFSCDCIAEKVEACLVAKPVDLVIIDTFGDICKDDISQSNNIRNLLNLFADTARRHGCFILFAHHIRKTGENTAPSKLNALGSQAFEAKMRVLIELRRSKRTKDLLHLCIVKGNYLPNDYKQQSFDLQTDSDMNFTATGGRTELSEINSYLPVIPPVNEEQLALMQQKEKDKETIIKLYKQGKSIREISELVPQSKSTVQRIIKSENEA
mgnify:FL=1